MFVSCVSHVIESKVYPTSSQYQLRLASALCDPAFDNGYKDQMNECFAMYSCEKHMLASIQGMIPVDWTIWHRFSSGTSLDSHPFHHSLFSPPSYPLTAH